MDKTLTWFIRTWVAFAIIVNVVSITDILVTENNFSYIVFIFSPLFVLTLIMQLVLFSPAIGAYFWLKHRRKIANARHPARAAPSPAASDQTTEKPNDYRNSLDYLALKTALGVLGTMGFWAIIFLVGLAPAFLHSGPSVAARGFGLILKAVLFFTLHYWPIFVLILLLLARPDGNIQRNDWRVLGAWCFITGLSVTYLVAIGVLGDQGGWTTFGLVFTGISSIATAIATIIGATVGDLLFQWYRMPKAASP